MSAAPYVQYTRFAKIPPSLMRLMVEERIGRNGWAVMVAYCLSIRTDRTFNIKPARVIGEITGLNPNQVARGMKELRDRGIIVPVIRENAQGYEHPDRSNHGHVAQYCFTAHAWQRIASDLKNSTGGVEGDR